MEHEKPELDEEQLEHSQVYVQLLKDLDADTPLSLNWDMKVQEVASQIQ